MTAFRPMFVVALALFAAAAVQGSLAPMLAVGPAQPDFVLLTLACGVLIVGPSSALGLGVWAGILSASLLLGFVGSLLVSRLLAGLLAGFLSRIIARDSPLTPPLVTLAVTLAAEGAYVILAPGHLLQSGASARLWAMQTGGETLYNLLLSLPLAFVLRRLAGRAAAESPAAFR